MARFRDVKQSALRLSPGAIFGIDIAWLIVLVTLAFGLANNWKWLAAVHDPFGHVMPFVVPWMGTLGGVAISLVGVVEHSGSDWNPAVYGYWHLVRPIFGMLFGSVAVLIIVLVLTTVKVPTDTAGYTPTGEAVLGVFAFVVGYREATFRSLLKRVTDVILGPSGADQALPVAVVPTRVDLGTVSVPGTTTQDVHFFNGSGDTVHLTPDHVSVGPADGLSVATFAETDVATGASASITLRWQPPVAGVLDTMLTVNASNQLCTARVVGTAVAASGG